MFVSDPKKPVGGHVMAHASTIRLSLRKGKAEQRLMKVVDAPNLGKTSASYRGFNTGKQVLLAFASTESSDFPLYRYKSFWKYW